MTVPDAEQVEVRVPNTLGLHLRAAMKFVDQAGSFAADIHVMKDGRRVNGKSILEMMTLAAEKGTVLRIEARGEDSESALAALRGLVEDGFGEE